jgi:hypothetical protein
MKPSSREPQVIDLLATAETPRPVGLERMWFEKRRVSIAAVERFRDWTRTGKAVDPDADIDDLIEDIRINTKLIHCTGASHTLRGMGGMQTLTEVCEAWNRSGFDQPDPTRCAGDMLSQKSRSNFHLSI